MNMKELLYKIVMHFERIKTSLVPKRILSSVNMSTSLESEVSINRIWTRSIMISSPNSSILNSNLNSYGPYEKVITIIIKSRTEKTHQIMANISLVKGQLITFTFALSFIMKQFEDSKRTCYQS